MGHTHTCMSFPGSPKSGQFRCRRNSTGFISFFVDRLACHHRPCHAIVPRGVFVFRRDVTGAPRFVLLGRPQSTRSTWHVCVWTHVCHCWNSITAGTRFHWKLENLTSTNFSPMGACQRVRPHTAQQCTHLDPHMPQTLSTLPARYHTHILIPLLVKLHVGKTAGWGEGTAPEPRTLCPPVLAIGWGCQSVIRWSASPSIFLCSSRQI